MANPNDIPNLDPNDVRSWRDASTDVCQLVDVLVGQAGQDPNTQQGPDVELGLGLTHAWGWSELLGPAHVVRRREHTPRDESVFAYYVVTPAVPPQVDVYDDVTGQAEEMELLDDGRLNEVSAAAIAASGVERAMSHARPADLERVLSFRSLLCHAVDVHLLPDELEQ
jgi:hypothetical protein